MKAREIEELVGGELRGDGDVEIVSVSDFSTAGPEQIAFIEKPNDGLTTNAVCLFVPTGFDPLSAISRYDDLDEDDVDFSETEQY